MTPPPLIAIGASAGGPSALARLLGGLPAGFDAALVVVQHLDDEFAAGLATWLGRQSDMPVRVARPGDVPRAGVVLLVTGSDHMVLDEQGTLQTATDVPDCVYRPSVDVFFDSLAARVHAALAGVLLTGMGRDGARGLKTLRRAGIFTIAQDQATSAVYGMPKAAVALDAADVVLPLESIAARLVDLVATSNRRHKGNVHG